MYTLPKLKENSSIYDGFALVCEKCKSNGYSVIATTATVYLRCLECKSRILIYSTSGDSDLQIVFTPPANDPEWIKESLKHKNLPTIYLDEREKD